MFAGINLLGGKTFTSTFSFRHQICVGLVLQSADEYPFSSDSVTPFTVFSLFSGCCETVMKISVVTPSNVFSLDVLADEEVFISFHSCLTHLILLLRLLKQTDIECACTCTSRNWLGTKYDTVDI